jgi:hypothetical protein
MKNNYFQWLTTIVSNNFIEIGRRNRLICVENLLSKKSVIIAFSQWKMILVYEKTLKSAMMRFDENLRLNRRLSTWYRQHTFIDFHRWLNRPLKPMIVINDFFQCLHYAFHRLSSIIGFRKISSKFIEFFQFAKSKTVKTTKTDDYRWFLSILPIDYNRLSSIIIDYHQLSSIIINDD